VRPIAFHIPRRSQAIIASLLTGMVLLLNALAVSPSLHEWFHGHPVLSQHQCAVTLFAQGQMDLASVDLPIAASLSFVQTVSSVDLAVFSPAIEYLPAGRAPPAASPNS
jgi:hypothetical protein